MTMTEQRALGDILVRHGVVTPEVLEPLYTQQREKGAQLTELLVQAKAASEADVARALAIECGLSFQERVDIEEVPTHTATRLPIGYAKNHKVLILGEYDDRVEIVRFVTVVEVVEDPITQLDREHARLFAPRAKVGETIAVALTFGPFLQAGLAEDDRWYRGRRKGD